MSGWIPRTGIALALLSAAFAAPASAGTWSSLTAPQATWDQPFRLQYDAVGAAYAITNASGGATSLFVRPAAGGAFAVSGPPIAGNGLTAMSPSDNNGRVQFVGARSGNIEYRRRGSGGNFAGAGTGVMTESDIGDGIFPTIGVNGLNGHALAVWPTSLADGTLTIKLGSPIPLPYPFIDADTVTGTPKDGFPWLFPFEGVAVDDDASGVIVYTDDVPGNGNLSFIVRDPVGTPRWGAANAIGDASTSSIGTFAADLSGDAMLAWKEAPNTWKSSWHARDTSAFTSPQTMPAGEVAGLVMQPDGAAVVAILNQSDSTNHMVQLYRRATGISSTWDALGGAHNVGVNDLVGLAASRTGDRIVFAWDQKPADAANQAYRIFAQAGSSAGMSPTDGEPLPGQPATPGLGGSNHNSDPVVAIDPNGNAVAFWDAHRPGGPGPGVVATAVFDPAGTIPPPENPPANNPPANNPPANNPPANNNPTPPSPDFPSLLPPGTIKVGNGTLNVPTFCAPSATDGCTGAIGTVIAGSYNPGGQVFAARIKRFSYRLKAVRFTLKAGQRKTVKVKLSTAAKKAVKAALRHRGGKATVTFQATVNGRKGRRKIVKFKR